MICCLGDSGLHKPYLLERSMEYDNDPGFWKWLIEQQKHQNERKVTYKPLVLELPIRPRKWKPIEQEQHQEKPPEHNEDVDDDKCVIFEL